LIGNLILDHYVKDKLFLERLTLHFKDEKLSTYEDLTLYEVKDGELVWPIDDYIRHKPLDYKHKFKFTLKEHESKMRDDKIFTEFYCQSVYPENDDLRI
jgi:hypothetical protein